MSTLFIGGILKVGQSPIEVEARLTFCLLYKTDWNQG